jgi:dienelactone hydrolase
MYPITRLAVTFVVAFGVVVPATASADRPGPAHNFAVTREGDARLPGHTVLHPTALDNVPFRMPIVVWGNGGCRNSNEEFRYFLRRFAAMGFFIVANGPPENPYHPEELAGIADPQPQKLIDAIDWALKENGRAGSKYAGTLDPTRIAVMGQSCGGWEAIDASADTRVDTTIAWNNGTTPGQGGDVTKLHRPILFVSGGMTDYSIQFTIAGYSATPGRVPAVYANHPDAGHTGLWDDPAEPAQPPGPYQDEPLVLAPNWLAFTLYGDPTGRAFYLGDGCGLCTRNPWVVESKNWATFRPAQTEAPSRVAAPVPPAGEACPANRTVTMRIRRPGVRSIVVYVGGRRVRTQRSRTVRLSLPATATGRARVRLVLRLRGGRRQTVRREYRVCTS